MNTIEKILNSIEVGNDGQYVIKEKDRLATIKVLFMFEEMYRTPGNEDWHHGITDTLNLLLSNEEYEQWHACEDDE